MQHRVTYKMKKEEDWTSWTPTT